MYQKDSAAKVLREELSAIKPYMSAIKPFVLLTITIFVANCKTDL